MRRRLIVREIALRFKAEISGFLPRHVGDHNLVKQLRAEQAPSTRMDGKEAISRGCENLHALPFAQRHAESGATPKSSALPPAPESS